MRGRIVQLLHYDVALKLKYADVTFKSYNGMHSRVALYSKLLALEMKYYFFKRETVTIEKVFVVFNS